MMWASRLAALTNGSVSKDRWCKENQNSRNRNVLCSVVDVKQYYCLSYRMWKGTIRCVVPVLIYSQDSHSILSSLSKGPYSVCLSLHCHSPPQKSPKFQLNSPSPSPMVESHLSWSLWAISCQRMSFRAIQNYLCSEKGFKFIHNIIVIEILSSSLLLL